MGVSRGLPSMGGWPFEDDAAQPNQRQKEFQRHDQLTAHLRPNRPIPPERPVMRPAAGPAFLPLLAVLASLASLVLVAGLFAFLVWPA